MSAYTEVFPPGEDVPLNTAILTGAGTYTPTVSGGSWHRVLMVSPGMNGANGDTNGAGAGGTSGGTAMFRIYLTDPVNYSCGAGNTTDPSASTIFGTVWVNSRDYRNAYENGGTPGYAASGTTGGAGAPSLFGPGGTGATPTTPATAAASYGAGGGGGAKGTTNTNGTAGGSGAIYIEEFGP